ILHLGRATVPLASLRVRSGGSRAGSLAPPQDVGSLYRRGSTGETVGMDPSLRLAGTRVHGQAAAHWQQTARRGSPPDIDRVEADGRAACESGASPPQMAGMLGQRPESNR